MRDLIMRRQKLVAAGGVGILSGAENRFTTGWLGRCSEGHIRGMAVSLLCFADQRPTLPAGLGDETATAARHEA